MFFIICLKILKEVNGQENISESMADMKHAKFSYAVNFVS